MTLTMFDLRVLKAAWVVRERAESGFAQATVQELGLELTAENVARVLVSLEKICDAGRAVLERERV
jgi:hypothetical protein